MATEKPHARDLKEGTIQERYSISEVEEERPSSVPDLMYFNVVCCLEYAQAQYTSSTQEGY
jgi:hypothetical protein